MRSEDYPPLLKKEVVGEEDFHHRPPNPYTGDGKALVSLVVADEDIGGHVQKAVELLGGLDKALSPGASC
jgi:hypothetical protein